MKQRTNIETNQATNQQRDKWSNEPTERQMKQRTNIHVFFCHHSSRRRQDGRHPSTAPQQRYGKTLWCIRQIRTPYQAQFSPDWTIFNTVYNNTCSFNKKRQSCVILNIPMWKSFKPLFTLTGASNIRRCVCEELALNLPVFTCMFAAS